LPIVCLTATRGARSQSPRRDRRRVKRTYPALVSAEPQHPAHTGLPVEDVIPELRAALAGDGVAVLQAEPGAGKTTLVPLRLLDEPWLAGARIVVMEPRRVAARAAAARMANLLSEEVGVTVGYVTRDDRQVSRLTRIEVVTDGILTRRLQHERICRGWRW